MHLFNGIMASLFLGITLLITNLIQILSLLIFPFSRPAFRFINRTAAGTWWSLCDIGVKTVYGTKIILTGDEIPNQENTLIVLNHQSMSDIPVLFSLARQKKRLGDLKFFVKDIIKYCPGVGWGMLFLDCLFIKRNWLNDQDHILKVFDKVIRCKIPLWLVTFSEGTRLTPNNLAKSQAYAEKNGFEKSQHLLIPRTKGFVASVQSLKNHLDAVYDVTIAYPVKPPSIWQWIQGMGKTVHLHVKRYPIETIPLDSEKLSNWLFERFKEKDQRLAKFYQEGSLKD